MNEKELKTITMAELGNHVACYDCNHKDKRIAELEKEIESIGRLCDKLNNDYEEINKNNIHQTRELTQAERELKYCMQENAELKQQLKNAIVPKFYYKDIVYYIENVSGKPKIVECMVTGIVPYKHKKFYSYEIESLKPHYYCVDEEHIFATKEEAQQKLKELEEK